MSCPVCNSNYSDQFKYLNCESFDDSYLYKDIEIRKCNQCGHQYNYLTDKELKYLNKYYEQEYAPSNLSSNDKEGDKPGSNNSFNLKRYEQLFEFISPYITKDSRILDVGCATGGFINFLEEKGYKNLYGIEPIQTYVNKANNKNIKVGNVYLIPFEDNSFDIIILDQVLEHLSNLKLAMKVIRRVLDKGGLCYIGVPDAEKYNALYFYLMREHIQHFELKNIQRLALLNDFRVISKAQIKMDMIGRLELPIISVILKRSWDTYCWGIGREFMYLYPNTDLKNMDLILIDDTPHKQKQTFKGMKIHSSDILKEADKDSFLIITAKVHGIKLAKKARELGYKGEIINV